MLASVLPVLLELSSTPLPRRVTSVQWAITKTEKAKSRVRHAPLARLAMQKGLQHASCALLESTNLWLALRPAVPAPVGPSLLAARVLALSAPGVDTLLLGLRLVPLVLLDTMPTSLYLDLVLPALLAPDALVLATPIPHSVLLAPSNRSLPRPSASLAPGRLSLIKLELPGVHHALLPIQWVLKSAMPVVGCFLAVSAYYNRYYNNI